jgi:hypothetical protein
MVLSRERIDTGIDADVTNKEIRALDKVRYLINVSPAETTFVSCHRPAPSLPQEQYLCFGYHPQVTKFVFRSVPVWANDSSWHL